MTTSHNSQAQPMSPNEIRDLCHSRGIAVYQVGEVFGNAPPATLRQWFVAFSPESFPGIEAEALPLANTADDAYRNAVRILNL